MVFHCPKVDASRFFYWVTTWWDCSLIFVFSFKP